MNLKSGNRRERKCQTKAIEQRELDKLDGEIHMDGAYVNGYVRPKNKKSDRIDRRLAFNQKPNKRCVFVMRQKCNELAGAKRTLTFVIKSENQADIVNLARQHITKNSTICADENNAYDPLHGKFDTRRVNHSVEYRADDSTTNNLAESYFARFRRMQYGQVHRFGNEYLANYANEAAYREDTRRWPNGKIFNDIAFKCTGTKTHRDWCGYWQGNKRLTERLAA